jgi:death-on-curing protein
VRGLRSALLQHNVIVRNHPFLDGNKRTALVVSESFLALNGHELAAGDGACVVVVLRLASGDMPQIELETWFREHTRASA